MPGCLSYVVAKDPADENAIWITEVWDSQASHKVVFAYFAMRLVKIYTAAISDRRVIAIRRNRGLRRSSHCWTLIDVIGRLRNAASSIPLIRTSHEAMRVVASVLSRRRRLAMNDAR